jgi:hypothetical protein
MKRYEFWKLNWIFWTRKDLSNFVEKNILKNILLSLIDMWGQHMVREVNWEGADMDFWSLCLGRE